MRHSEAQPLSLAATQLALVEDGSGQIFPVPAGARLVVGRGQDSHVQLNHPSVSRTHAEIYRDDGGVHVRDLGSANGTFVAGARLQTGSVSLGDTVAFGSVTLRLVTVEPPPAPAAEPDAPLALSGATILREHKIGPSDRSLITELGAERAQGPERKLALLLEISKRLARVADLPALLDRIGELVFQVTEADWMAILLTDEQGELIPRLTRDRKGVASPRDVPRSIVRRAVAERVALLTHNAPEDDRFGGASILLHSVRSAMCAPLVGGEGTVHGVLYVDNVTATHQFGDEELDFLSAFSSMAAVAIENSKLSERSRREAVVRANFERYFAPNLAGRIAGSLEAVRLGGDRRTVSVLFSDIRGFTALAETMPPDVLASLLSEYFTVMVECVFRHGGALDKFIGDAVLAQWGAPIGAPDDPDRAMLAALDMLQELERLNAAWRAEGRPELQIGIGLNAGEVFAGNIGSERRLEFTIIGDVVNVAARLCAAAAAGEILLTDEMRRALAAPPPLRQRPPMVLKGKSQPVPLFSVGAD
ncbi:MAG: FHA domain-containing protein [Gemmatimonadales bacterium]|nr:FHA domain-containing protein [Gemmatimonadales bacterium]